MKKLLYIIAVVLCMAACEKNAPEASSTTKSDYVDLGLPSGTQWKAVNELNPKDSENGFYTYDEAIAVFGKNLPTIEQWRELVNECTWTWIDTGYQVVGSNGKSITLPAAGIRYASGTVKNVGSQGAYWSSTLESGYEEAAWDIIFKSGVVSEGSYNRNGGQSVRLVR